MKYKLLRSRRRTLSLEISGGELVVRSPYFLPLKIIENFINSKADWVNKKLKAFADHKKNRLIHGEKVYYLGETVDLKVIETKRTNSVCVYQKSLIVRVCDKQTIPEIVREFYCEQTSFAVEKILNKYKNTFDFDENIRVKHYQSKFGSCTRYNKLCFNANLAMAPVEVIEYVVLHELTHTKIKDHSRRFWLKLFEYDPDYKKHRKWLRENSLLLKI